MNESEKQSLYTQAQKRITAVQKAVALSIEQMKQTVNKKIQTRNSVSPGEQLVIEKIIEHYNIRTYELQRLKPSPYFTRCVVQFDDETVASEIYIGKFSFDEKQIYSWITPVAMIRFESPGSIAYTKPGGTKRLGKLLQKDQFMIVDGNIIFMATESIEEGQTLVYQEYLSQQKQGFVLPEIVAQMERAQDQVIRADYKGPMVISGPAGSGKTTLALHRIAFLLQSPETTKTFTALPILVLVQDSGSKAYFSELLPQLGITSVAITTFAEWAYSILQLSNMYYVSRFGTDIAQKDQYEFAKKQLLTQSQNIQEARTPYATLEQVYKQLPSSLQPVWKKQQQQKVLDRFDLTLLLLAHQTKNNGLYLEQDTVVELANGKLKRKKIVQAIEYSMILLDEFQNYLPEQMQLLQQTTASTTDAMLYVGDPTQQTLIGVSDNQKLINSISKQRKVFMDKVYRNTKEILQYIQSLGYEITIPDAIQNGQPVTEKQTTSVSQASEYIQTVISQNIDAVVGVITFDSEHHKQLTQQFKKHTHVHILSIYEAQGLEFDIAILAGFAKSFFMSDYDAIDPELSKQKRKALKDLVYVGLTRAKTGLYVVGDDKLHNYLAKIS